MELRALRDKAAEAFKKGRFVRSAEYYAEYCEKDPRDAQARLRMGDAWAKAGEKDQAIRAWISASEAFAREGFLPRAIAAAKLVLEVDSAHRGIQQLLADLYARKSNGAPSPAPTAPSPAPVAAQERVADPAPVSSLPPELDPSLYATAFRFDELSLEDAPGDSLLHAVDRAALTGQTERGEATASDDEETVFTIEVTSGPAVPDALPTIPLFSELPPEAFIELFERCPLRRFGPGDRVIAQGSRGEAFYVVCEGSVVVRRSEEGVEKDLATLEEGAFFGEMALLSGAPRAASVDAASEDTRLLEISASVLAELSTRHPSVATALKRFCRQRMLTNVMGSSPLFRPFSRSDRRALVERFRAREVPGGASVIVEGQESDGLYVVLSGELEVCREGQVLARLREGELFGEMSLLKKAPATATVRALRRASLIRLPRSDFDELVLTHPQVLMLVSELTDDRQRQNEAIIAGEAEVGEEGLLLV